MDVIESTETESVASENLCLIWHDVHKSHGMYLRFIFLFEDLEISLFIIKPIQLSFIYMPLLFMSHSYSFDGCKK